MESKPVNVLEVIDREMVRRAVDRISFASQNSPKLVPLCEGIARDCREAQSAILELIAANEDYDAAMSAVESHTSGQRRRAALKWLETASLRRAEALARVKR